MRASSGSDYTFGYGHDRLPDNVSCALGETSRQRQPPPLPVDRHYSHPNDVACVYRPGRVRNPFATKLGDVDQSLYTLREPCERPVRHHERDVAPGLIGLKSFTYRSHGSAPERLIDSEIR